MHVEFWEGAHPGEVQECVGKRGRSGSTGGRHNLSQTRPENVGAWWAKSRAAGGGGGVAESERIHSKVGVLDFALERPVLGQPFIKRVS